jgi:Flp pilus assembly protein TadG
MSLGFHHKDNSLAPLPPRIERWSIAKMFRRLFRENQGSQLVEFAVVLPLLAGLIMGIIAFGQAFSIDQTLTNAAAAGAQALSISRGTNALDPCMTVSSPAFNVASSLNRNNIKFTITITPPTGVTGGTTYTLATNQTNPTCAAANTTSAPATDVQVSYNANVTLTYPCAIEIYGVNFAPNCTLTAETTEVIQ